MQNKNIIKEQLKLYRHDLIEQLIKDDIEYKENITDKDFYILLPEIKFLEDGNIEVV